MAVPGAAPDATLRRETALTRSQLRDAAAMFARSLGEDPLFADFFPARTTRQKALTTLFETVLRDGLRHGQVDLVVADGKMVGGIVWYRPGRFPPSLVRQLRLIPMCLKLARLTPRAVWKLVRAQRKLDEIHPREPHHYLYFAVVEPGHQGSGLGKLLLTSVIADADAHDLPCYLETQDAGNVAWYARLGFETVHDGLETVPGSPPTWTMWRPARSADPNPRSDPS